MKKLLLSFAVVMLVSASVCAQSKTSASASMSKKSTISLAVNGGVSTSTVYGAVFGADLQGAFPVATGLDLTLSAGYENYSVKSQYGGGHSSFIPILGGARVPFSAKVYGHGQLGYAFSTVSGGGGAFAYAPSIGVWVSPNFDISVKYLGLSNNGSLGAVFARLAYNF